MTIAKKRACIKRTGSITMQGDQLHCLFYNHGRKKSLKNCSARKTLGLDLHFNKKQISNLEKKKNHGYTIKRYSFDNIW